MLEISVGIPSYNEGASILNLIATLNSETLAPNMKLLEVLVTDDSHDGTERKLEELATKYNSLRILHHQERRGVSAAWNEILREARGDVIVLVDADVIPSNTLLSTLSSKIFSSPGIGLVAANSSPLQPATFFGRASYFVGVWLQEVRRSFHANQFTVIGRGLALRSEVAKKVVLPTDLLSPDLYLGCRVKELGFEIAYAEDAIVHFKPTESVRDFASQVVRASLGHKQLNGYSQTTLQKVSMLNQMAKALYVAKEHPIHAIATGIAYALLPFNLPRVIKGASSHLWEVPQTSKLRES